MGRRALRKIDPALDIQRHFRPLAEVARPLDVTALLGRSGPVEIEIGSGKGLFLTRASAERPEHLFVGIELAVRYARYAASRLAKAERDNALVIQGDGVVFCEQWLMDDSIEAVHVYFPDPWWKSRHRRRRVLQEPLARSVQRVLRPGGTLHFWTDVREYFDDGLAVIRACTSLSGPHEVPEQEAQADLDYRTHFERRTRLAALPVYRAEFHKT